jgi:hypothetical protein
MLYPIRWGSVEYRVAVHNFSELRADKSLPLNPPHRV